jgi:hypothetical protein
MKHLVGKALTEKVPFMGDEVEVKKLTVGQILDMQGMIAESNKTEGAASQVKLLRDIIQLSVVGADELTEEEFSGFPMAELNTLSEEIMRVSGLGGGEGN